MTMTDPGEGVRTMVGRRRRGTPSRPSDEMQPLKSGTRFGQVPHPHGTIGFAPEGAPSPQGARSLIGLGVRPPSAGLPRRLDVGEKPGWVEATGTIPQIASELPSKPRPSPRLRAHRTGLEGASPKRQLLG